MVPNRVCRVGFSGRDKRVCMPVLPIIVGGEFRWDAPGVLLAALNWRKALPISNAAPPTRAGKRSLS